jgi:hypothetical protein
MRSSGDRLSFDINWRYTRFWTTFVQVYYTTGTRRNILDSQPGIEFLHVGVLYCNIWGGFLMNFHRFLSISVRFSLVSYLLCLHLPFVSTFSTT